MTLNLICPKCGATHPKNVEIVFTDKEEYKFKVRTVCPRCDFDYPIVIEATIDFRTKDVNYWFYVPKTAL